jgi:fructose-1,6-bisphosphatase I
MPATAYGAPASNSAGGGAEMRHYTPLSEYLEDWAGDMPLRRAIAATVQCIADSGKGISDVVARGLLAGALGAAAGPVNADGDAPKQLDIEANAILLGKLFSAPVAAIASEELTEPKPVDPGAALLVAVDPLDGSSNIDTNVSVGTIFSVLHAEPREVLAKGWPAGNRQCAAGYIIYGPQTALALTLGAGTHLFTLDPGDRRFKLTAPDLRIPQKTREFAINASNFRHWDDHIRAYVDDCLAGETGPRGVNYNMRWIASLVAECHRILMRGGVAGFTFQVQR